MIWEERLGRLSIRDCHILKGLVERVLRLTGSQTKGIRVHRGRKEWIVRRRLNRRVRL